MLEIGAMSPICYAIRFDAAILAWDIFETVLVLSLDMVICR